MSLEHNDKIEWVEISSLKGHPKNPNKHSKDQIARLADILKYQGFRSPIVVSNRSGFIVAGHGRLEAAQKLGLTKVPVSHQDFTDDEQEYAHMVADNAIADWADLDLSQINMDIGELGPDFDVDLLGIKDFEIEPADKYADQDADHVPENVPAKAKLGDIYQLGQHRLMCGDSTDLATVEKLMAGEKADMLCWDPPWNVGFEYNEYEDDKSDEEYGGFLASCLGNFNKISKPSFVAVVWQSEKNWTNFHKWFPAQARMIAVTKNFVQRAKGYLQRAWDPAFMWHGPEYQHKKTKEHNQRDYFLSNTAATHNDGTGIRVAAGAHPCPRQVDVYEYFITGWAQQGAVIVDLCGGSGTALIACEKTNRKCFMMELDPHYVDVIIARWEKFTGQKAERITSAAKSEAKPAAQKKTKKKKGKK